MRGTGTGKAVKKQGYEAPCWQRPRARSRFLDASEVPQPERSTPPHATNLQQNQPKNMSSDKDRLRRNTTVMDASDAIAAHEAAAEPPKKVPTCKICCACPDTRKVRDECIVENGEEKCAAMIEAHKVCLRGEGFNV